MNDSVVITEVDSVTNVVLSKAEKHVPYGGSRMYNVIGVVSNEPKSL